MRTQCGTDATIPILEKNLRILLPLLLQNLRFFRRKPPQEGAMAKIEVNA